MSEETCAWLSAGHSKVFVFANRRPRACYRPALVTGPRLLPARACYRDVSADEAALCSDVISPPGFRDDLAPGAGLC